MLLTSRFEDALVYATRTHSEQCRKRTTIPYACHLLAVASLVLEDGGDEDEAIAGLLHDAPEDQPLGKGESGGRDRLEDIRVRFGERVAQIVDGCTDTFATPKPPWRPRKEAYIESLSGKDPGTLRVSLADKLHNARSILSDYREIGDKVWERFNAGREDQLWYYRSLIKKFRTLTTSRMAGELDLVIAELAPRSK